MSSTIVSISIVIYKHLNVSGRPAIFDCGVPIVKASDILDFYHKPLMQYS